MAGESLRRRPATTDIAGKAHWDRLWSEAPLLSEAVDPVESIEQRWPESQLAREIRRHLLRESSTLSVLEIGCADSTWLPYFAGLGFEATGIDYSEIGCERARQRLDAAGVSATVVVGDALADDPVVPCSFDLVVSFGVVEHFSDTTAVLAAFARFCRPGGLVVTEIPNMTGLNGVLQRLFEPSVFRMHVPLTSKALSTAHREAGLSVLRDSYVVAWSLGAVNIGRKPRAVRRAWDLAVGLSSRAARWFDRRGRSVPVSRLLSPYVICVARKPSEA